VCSSGRCCGELSRVNRGFLLDVGVFSDLFQDLFSFRK